VTTGAALALTLPQPAQASLAAVLVLATAVWIGGLVAIFVMARVAHAPLGATERVAFFRGLGRAYGLAGRVAQARRMSRLRQDALRHPGSLELAAKVRRGARNATVLRAAIAALSLALLALGTVIAT
jgi:hypothetical protein